MRDTELAPRRKSKRERFLTVAERRTIRVLKDVQLLAKCANRASYQYDMQDVEKIFGAIEDEIRRTKGAFTRDKGVNFSLADVEDDEPPTEETSGTD